MKWVRKPKMEPVKSPDGRFTLTIVLAAGGYFAGYRLTDTTTHRRWRRSRLAEIRDAVRETAGDIYDHDTLERVAWAKRQGKDHPCDVYPHDEDGLVRGHNSTGGAVHYLTPEGGTACNAWRLRGLKSTPELRATCHNCISVARSEGRSRIAQAVVSDQH